MKLPRPLTPYFHPTSVIFVDDNYNFSNSLTLTIPDDLVLTAYLSPEQALHDINQPHPRPPLADMCFTRDGSLLQLDLNVLEEEIKHPDRFSRVSVLLVDYAMPTMNGLDFCAAVEDRDIRRVLLTGVADEKTAVAAFNKGLIDHYLPKANLATPGGIIPYIEDQQHRYFQRYLDRITKALGIRPPQFTVNSGFLDYFETLLEQEQIVEFYLVAKPTGYLMLTENGTTLQLIVQDQAAQTEVGKVMDEFNAPNSIRRAVASGAEMLCLFEHPNDYLGDEPFPWQEFTFPATQIDTQLTCGLVRDPPLDIDFDPHAACYTQHLNNLHHR